MRPIIVREIATELAICRAEGCQLIVNDYWREAIDLGAAFVHLGQEDLADADLAAIRRAGIRLGISTHTPEELQIALEAEPDHVALGPIYETTLKAMKYPPAGAGPDRRMEAPASPARSSPSAASRWSALPPFTRPEPTASPS